MADLQNLSKLFVLVPQAKCESFRNSYIVTPQEGSRNTKYDNRLVFLEDTHQLWSQGNFYSLNSADVASSTDINEVKNILSGFSYSSTGKNKSVIDSLDEILAGLTNTGVLTISRDAATGAVSYSSALQLNATKSGDTYTGIQLTGGAGFTAYNIPFAASGDEMATETAYAGVTSKAVKEYVASQLGDIANALEFKGGNTELDAELASSSLSAKNVGDMFIIDGAHADITVGGKTYKLEVGDSVIVTAVTSKAVSAVTVVERNLDGAVTASETLVDNHVVLGGGNQTLKNTSYVLGGDTFAASGNSTIIATEAGAKAYTESYTASYVVSYINGNQSTATTGADHSVSFSDGLLNKSAGEALNAYIAYVGGMVDDYDQSETTVSSGSAYLWVADNGTGNDHDYVVNAYVQTLGDAIGMTYVEGEGWHAGDGSNVQPGLAYAYNVAYEIVKDEQVIAAALNDHESRIQAAESAIAGTSISGTENQISVSHNGNAYTVAAVTGAVSQSSQKLATGAQIASYVASHVSEEIGKLDATITYNSTYFSYSIAETDGKLTSTSINIDPVLALLNDPWETIE